MSLLISYRYFKGCQLKINTLVVGGPYIGCNYRILLLTIYTNLANFYITKMAKLFTL